MGTLILLLGGVCSGKSTYAEQLAHKIGGADVLYVATAEVKDDEMRERAIAHQSRRPDTWRTLETPGEVGAGIRREAGNARAVLLDCITVLTANILMEMTGPYDEDAFSEPNEPFRPEIEAQVLREVEAVADCARDLDTTLIVVSNEVGMGVVPPYELGRAYRDLLGRANQTLASRADTVILLVAGIPMLVKGDMP